jgi:hypothetical protein
VSWKSRRANQQNPVQPLREKYSTFAVGQISGLNPPVSPDNWGARDRHERAVGCGGRDARVRRTRVWRTAKTCGPDASALASSFCGSIRESDGGKKADHRGERAISRKAIAQGMSDCLRCPVCSCAHFLVHIAHETAGAARIRHSLRPLISEGENFLQTSGATRRENAKAHPPLSVKSQPHTRRRPGPEPGPISTNVSCCATLELQSLSPRSSVVVDPGVRRDDDERVRWRAKRACHSHNNSGSSATIASPTAMLPPVVTSA